MKNLAQTLEELKPQFIEKLQYQLFIYTTIGSGTYESPMWIQMDSIWGDVELKFSNSQKTSNSFYIAVDKEAQQLIKDYREECYDYFKYVKYTHIRDNAPTVWAELAAGYNGDRINSFMKSYQPPVVKTKSKIEQLLENGELTLQEIMEYAQKYMNAVDKHDDEQIDKYYQEDYFEQYNMEFDQAEHERMMYSQDMYGQEDQDMYGSEWESNDPNAPDYEDTQDVEWPTHTRSSNPEYVIASTSFKLEETYVFEADRNGKILDLGEYGGIAKRWEYEDWQDHKVAIYCAMGDVPYRFEKRIETGMDGVYHYLYSRIGSADFWDGDESDKALQ